MWRHRLRQVFKSEPDPPVPGAACPRPPVFPGAAPVDNTRPAIAWAAAPLHHLCWSGQTAVALAWVDADPAHNLRVVYKGETLLHVACRFGHGELARGLLERGIDAAAVSVAGNTALHLAGRVPDIVAVLTARAPAAVNLQNNARETPLHCAAKDNWGELVRALLDHGADPLLLTDDGSSALHYAAKYGAVAAAKQLLAHPRCAVLVNRPNQHGNTPLHSACTNGCAEIGRMLLAHGAAPMALNLRGQTPRQLGTNRFGIANLFEVHLWRQAVRVFLLVCYTRDLVTDGMLLDQLFGPDGYVFRFIDRGNFVHL